MDLTLASLLLLLLTLLPACESILLRDVGVPSFAVQGKEAVLSCDYDLEGQELYAVKWYKNGLEFYRYLPSSRKPTTVYARPGVNVDRDRTDGHRLTLSDLTQKSTGRYRCEVSTEAPSFATVSNFGDMVVVVLPDSGPKIRGGRQRYRLGDVVDVNCTSRESKPAADLLWFINGEPADESYLVRYPISTSHSDLHTTTLGLRFNVTKEHFPKRRGGSRKRKGADAAAAAAAMKLKCTATIASIYWQSNEKSAEGMKMKRGAANSSRGDSEAAGRPGSFVEDRGTDFDGQSSAFGSESSAGGGGGGGAHHALAVAVAATATPLAMMLMML